jgi:hypothetical protein
VAKNAAKPLYRAIAEVTFRYVSLSNAYVTKGGLGATYLTEGEKIGIGPGKGVVRKRRQKPGTPIMYPAIFVEAL